MTREAIEVYGFLSRKGSAHTARTIMLNELQALFSYIDRQDAEYEAYRKAIINENCLGKPSQAARKETATRLTNLYSLNPEKIIFRVLRFFWNRDELGQPLLAFLCAYTRDRLLRKSKDYVFSLKHNEKISKHDFELYLDNIEPGRYSEKTLSSVVRNLSSSWTQSGHLVGRTDKTRSRVEATSGSVSYALYLGHLKGFKGESLFLTEYIELLECSKARAVELAEIASRRGWINFKHIGNIMEVTFPW